MGIKRIILDMKAVLFAALMGFTLAAKQDNYYDLDEPTDTEGLPAPEYWEEDEVVVVVEEPDYTAVGNGYTLADLVNLIKENDAAQDMAAQITAEFQLYFDAQMALLPEVCEGGLKCRQDILTAAKHEVQLEWQKSLAQIRIELENVLTISNFHLTNAYSEAWECEPECPCRDIEVEYTYLIEQINEKQIMIDEWTQDIQELWEKIRLIDEQYPDYAYLHEQYEAEWAMWYMSTGTSF